MAHNKSPGPDGFTAKFYKHYWDLVKHDLKAIFDDFHSGSLDISRLNYGIITLISKTKDANQIQKFKPIFLLNVSFKFFTQILMNRLNGFAREVVSPIQTAFIKGRHIMEGVIILQEALNTIHHQIRVKMALCFVNAYN